MDRVPAQPQRELMHAQLARVEQPVQLHRGEVPRHSCSNSSARYSCTCQGLSERGGPPGASVSTLGVETKPTPARRPRASGSARAPRRVLEVLDRLQEHDGVGGLGERLDEIALEAQVGGGGSAAARARAPRGWHRRRRPRGGAREHVRAIALAAGHVDHAQSGHARGDPLIHGQMAAKPVVLLGHVRQRALARQLQRRDAVRLIALQRRLGGTDTAREYMVPPRAAQSHRRGDPRRQHALPRRGGRPLRRQVGHRLRGARRRTGAGEGAQGTRRRRAGALPAGAGDRRRDRLLHAEHAARGTDRAGDVQRHLAGHAAARCKRTPSGWGSRSRPSPRTPSSCRSRTRASTWCSATRCCTTSPTWSGRWRSSRACSRPAARSLFAGEPSRYGDRLAGVPKRAAAALAPVWRRAVGARPAPARGGRGAGGGAGGAVDVHAFAPAELAHAAQERGSAGRARRGEELLANWFGWTNRTLEATAEPARRAVGVAPVRLPRLSAAAGLDRRLLEPRLPPAIFYNLMLTARTGS